MAHYRAVFRDDVSDRSPVREEIIVEAENLELARASAQGQARGGLQLIEVVPLGREPSPAEAKGSSIP